MVFLKATCLYSCSDKHSRSSAGCVYSRSAGENTQSDLKVTTNVLTLWRHPKRELMNALQQQRALPSNSRKNLVKRWRELVAWSRRQRTSMLWNQRTGGL